MRTLTMTTGLFWQLACILFVAREAYARGERAPLEELESDHDKRMRGMPCSPMGANGGRNPAYSREILGTDMDHPTWLGHDVGDSRLFQGSSSMYQLINGLATSMDKNSDHVVSFDELQVHMYKIAKLRMLAEIKATESRAVGMAQSTLETFAHKTNGLSLREVLHMDQHVDMTYGGQLHQARNPKTGHWAPHNVGLKPIYPTFHFADINGDQHLNGDEYTLYIYKLYDQDHHASGQLGHMDDHDQYVRAELPFITEGAAALIRLCDEDRDDGLSIKEMMDHFTHFVTPRGQGGTGSRGGMIHHEL